METICKGKFVKKLMNGLNNKRGCYRGPGRIIVDENGLKIVGQHIHTTGNRTMIIILAIFICLIASAVTAGAAIIPGVAILYYLVEYGFLKREDVCLSFDQIKSFGYDDKEKLVGIAFDGYQFASPAILHSDNGLEIFNILKNKIPEKNITYKK